MNEEQERRRVERIRKQQLGARDPGESKIPGFDWSQQAAKSRKIQRKKKQRSLIAEIYDVLPTRYKGVIIGLLLSIIPAAAIYALAPGEFKALALLPPLIFGVVGMVLGAVMTNKPYS